MPVKKKKRKNLHLIIKRYAVDAGEKAAYHAELEEQV